MNLIILFGLAGAGKTYVGKVMANALPKTIFQDGDEWLTAEMLAAINARLPFTNNMRRHFVEIMVNEIRELQHRYPGHNLVIAQGLYKQESRNFLIENFPKAIFIEVRSQLENIKRRLYSRNDLISFDYAIYLGKGFESMPGSLVLQNDKDGDEEIIKKIKSITGVLLNTQ
jgi:gluconate kinase